MQTIPCPWCGPRDETEFRFGVEVGRPRPGPAENVTDEEWAAYLYFRRNEKGLQREAWCHDAGCGQWFVLTRDSATHAIAGAEPIEEAAGGAEPSS